MSHTPGPWHVFQKGGEMEVNAKDGRPIAEMWRRGKPELELADASLIAAAPDLLSTLEDVLDRLGALSNKNELLSLMDKEDADRVFAAIKKARGQ